MNTGERLIALSGLPSGSALAHFAAITQTSGAGGLVFASTFSVVSQREEGRVVSRAKKPVISDQPRRPESIDARKSAAFVFRSSPASYVKTCDDDVLVKTTTNSSVVTERPLKTTIKVKHGL